ncbi:hypothetical protein ANTRET_LOCUS819 [Anthophora retusa]
MNSRTKQTTAHSIHIPPWGICDRATAGIKSHPPAKVVPRFAETANQMSKRRLRAPKLVNAKSNCPFLTCFHRIRRVFIAIKSCVKQLHAVTEVASFLSQYGGHSGE